MRTPITRGIAVLAVLAIAACDQAPTTPELTQDQAANVEIDPPRSSTSGLTHSSAPFRNWHQGFNHGTEGWFGKNEPGLLGWCGTIDAQRRARGAGSMAPSAGRGYAVVEQDVCNAHWDGEFAGDEEGDPFYPLGTLVGVPWAPGPGFAAIGGEWPSSGYTVELDIYLDPDDPDYTAAPPPEGQWVFTDIFKLFGAPSLAEFYRNSVFTYSVSFEDPAGSFAFNYVGISVLEGSSGLSVGVPSSPSLTTITEAGWYTFRFVLTDDGGDLAITFELDDRRGTTLVSMPVASMLFAPTASPSDFTAQSIGTGYAWFTSVAEGLELPIDEYRIRRGR